MGQLYDSFLARNILANTGLHTGNPTYCSCETLQPLCCALSCDVMRCHITLHEQTTSPQCATQLRPT